MVGLFAALRRRRALSVLVCLCYALLSVAMPFQHHHPGEDRQPVPAPTSAEVRADAASHKRPVANVSLTSSKRCAACDWVAANVSPALSLYALPSCQEIAVLECRILTEPIRTRAIALSARGPPVL